jgi:hypothetical protein
MDNRIPHLLLQKIELPVYIRITEALETPNDNSGSLGCKTVEGITEVNDRISTLSDPLSAEEVTVATQLMCGHMAMEVPGRHSSEMPVWAQEAIALLDPRLLEDYVAAPYKHE